MEPLEVSELINDVTDLYQHVAEEKNVHVSKHLPSELPLMADRTRMRQVLANLLDNAIKYTPKNGHIDIQSSQEDGRIVVSIKDTGMGIPSQDIPKIWDRLYRGDESRSQPGLGLGLSFVKAIVESHHGSVDVVSQPGVGSCFTLRLPLLK